jgi:hypothetical protein
MRDTTVEIHGHTVAYTDIGDPGGAPVLYFHGAPMSRRNLGDQHEEFGAAGLRVITPDRPGLLACIGRIFMQFGIQLQNAKIATLGERVEDIFFITDSKGQPLSDPALCESLQQEICQQLDKRVSA